MITEYLKYLFKSHNLHGVHSPFVYDLNKNVFNRRCNKTELNPVKSYRNFLNHQNQKISIHDFGVGSKIHRNNERNIRAIYKTASTNSRFGEILYTLIKYFDCKNILEIGTGLGVGTAYMQTAINGDERAIINTIEGSPELTQFTKFHFSKFFPANKINFIEGTFDAILPGLLNCISQLDLALIDGNHNFDATISYFKMLLPKIHNQSIIIIDDINWSNEMKKAWIEIQKSPEATVTIDLYRWGLVFFRKEILKEHFIIRFDDFLKAHIS